MPEQRSGIIIFAEDEFSATFRKYGEALTKIEANTRQTATMITQSGRAMKTQETRVKGLVPSLLKAAGAYHAIRAAAKTMIATVKATITQSTLLAARVETLGVALNVVGRNAGYSQEQIDAFEKATKAQGITTQAARQSLLMMAQAQIDFAHAGDLARIAQDAAVIAQVDSSEAFQRLTYIIQTGSVLMGRSLGLQLDFQSGYKKMATQVDKTVDELSEQEKIQARVNVVMEAGVLIAGTYEGAMGTAGKLMYSLNRLFEEMQLVIGRISLGAFAKGIDEITRLTKDLGKWMEENEEQLEGLGVAVEMLTDQLTDLAEIPTEGLTDFVENLTTVISVLAVGVEAVRGLNKEITILGKSIDVLGFAMDAMVPGFRQSWKAISENISRVTELRKANEDLFKTEARLAEERAERLSAMYAESDALKDIRMQLEADVPAPEVLEPPDYEKIAEAVESTLDAIQRMQRDHNLRLQREMEDVLREQERAWADYGKQVAKTVKAGEKKLTKLETEYEEDRTEALADYQEAVVEAEEDALDKRLKAQENFERQAKQSGERFQLDQLQSQRRYEYERGRLVAEGDTLAIEQLDELYKLEQQEAQENEDLQQRQAQENFDAQIADMEDAAQDLLSELSKGLEEQLVEQEQAYREQLVQQQEANAEQLAEMAADFAERQQLEEEDRRLAAQRQEEDYQRQLADLGESLSDQLREHEFGAESVAALLEQFYGSGGVSDLIMEGYHEREATRIAITAAQLEALGSAATTATAAPTFPTTPEYHPEFGMDTGGVVRGPASVAVGPGMVEAFVPLGKMGGTMQHSFNPLDVNIQGLTGASQQDVNAIASCLARELTNQVRNLRRS